jgi:hypothetical protein
LSPSLVETYGPLGTGGDRLSDQILKVGGHVGRFDVGMAVVLAQEEYLGCSEGAQGVALAYIRINPNPHLDPPQLAVEPE